MARRQDRAFQAFRAGGVAVVEEAVVQFAEPQRDACLAEQVVFGAGVALAGERGLPNGAEGAGHPLGGRAGADAVAGVVFVVELAQVGESGLIECRVQERRPGGVGGGVAGGAAVGQCADSDVLELDAKGDLGAGLGAGEHGHGLRNMCGATWPSGMVRPVELLVSLMWAMKFVTTTPLRNPESLDPSPRRPARSLTLPKISSGWLESCSATRIASATGSMIHQCSRGWSGSCLRLIEATAGAP
ncbi:hypothetical protein [Micromonospora rubida]|uniref:hypothetical protein n=1 Tax=Micromonospora rubida TaxID=2697657 RepID=UPI001378D4CE|nr:hypothetical protein [Micromonospora rubida]NBE79531.1 hypothetical protein [Micromonospora rubida]